jgi:hypothetical protein
MQANSSAEHLMQQSDVSAFLKKGHSLPAEVIDLLRKLIHTKSSAMHLVALHEFCVAFGIDAKHPDIQELLTGAKELVERKKSSSSTGGKTSKRTPVEPKKVVRAASELAPRPDVELRAIIPSEDTLKYPIKCNGGCGIKIKPRIDYRAYRRINGEDQNFHSHCIPMDLEASNSSKENDYVE